MLTPLLLLLGVGGQDVTPAGHQLRQRNLLNVLLHQKESPPRALLILRALDVSGPRLRFNVSFSRRKEFSAAKNLRPNHLTSTQSPPSACLSQQERGRERGDLEGKRDVFRSGQSRNNGKKVKKSLPCSPGHHGDTPQGEGRGSKPRC